MGTDESRMVAAGVPAGHLHGWAGTPTPTAQALPWHHELNRLYIWDRHLHELTTDLILPTHVDDLHPIVSFWILG